MECNNSEIQHYKIEADLYYDPKLGCSLNESIYQMKTVQGATLLNVKLTPLSIYRTENGSMGKV
jgi:hypothetical protein